MFTQWLENICLNNLDLVGGKNASLGEMYRNLAKEGIKVPNGFVVTTLGYLEFIKYNNLNDQINQLLEKVYENPSDLITLRRNGLQIRMIIQNGEFPPEIEREILSNYLKLSQMYYDAFGKQQNATDVAIRSSSTAEDLQHASFA